MVRLTILTLGLVGAVTAAAAEGGPKDIEQLSSSYAEDTGDVQRIVSAEHLRTYSQEVAAAACFLYNDIDTELSRTLLVESRAGFDTHLAALVNGDESLGIIGGEERRKTIAKLNEIEAMWSPMATAVDALLADAGDAVAVGVIKNGNVPLFQKTDILVSEIEGQYSNPSVLLQIDALMLEIVGRQAMMTQKIAKNACKMFSGVRSAEIEQEMTTSISIYEASLNALLNGMPEVGIKPAPTPEIAEALKLVQADWADTRVIVDRIVAGEETGRDEQVYLFRHLVQEMARIEEIGHAYAEFSRHGS